MIDLKGVKIGFCICGSFCTFSDAFKEIDKLIELGADVTPIMSFNASSIDTRFGKAEDHIKYLEEKCNRAVIKSIVLAEPIGPKRMFDILVVAPCTSNTAAKLALGITDTPVTMAVKSHIRNARPVVIAVSTNDALGAAEKNIGVLRTLKNYYFVPVHQDDYIKKPNSMIAVFDLLPQTVSSALSGEQLQPLVVEKKENDKF